MNRNALQRLALIRQREARALLRLGHSSGAYYLSGYAVECGLKACIAKQTRRFDFPEKKRVEKSYTHNLRDLVQLADLAAALTDAQADPEFTRNWNIALEWSEQSRYRTHSKDAAAAIVAAVSEPKHGVLPWITRYW